MSCHHCTTFERARIEELSALEYSNRAIVKRLNHHRSSIDRELNRNISALEYSAEQAQAAYYTRHKQSKPHGKLTDELITIVTDKLLATWSPEQIANTVTLGQISFKTIYNWLYTGKIPTVEVKQLRQKGKRIKSEKRGKFSMGLPISQRPKEVEKRDVFEH